MNTKNAQSFERLCVDLIFKIPLNRQTLANSFEMRAFNVCLAIRKVMLVVSFRLTTNHTDYISSTYYYSMKIALVIEINILLEVLFFLVFKAIFIQYPTSKG